MDEMTLIVFLGLPLLGSLLAFLVRSYRPAIGAASVAVSVLELALAGVFARNCASGRTMTLGPGEFLRIDSLSAIMTLVVAGVSAVSFWFGVGYLERARDQQHLDSAALRRYYILMHLFVFTMLLAVTTNNVGVMWIAVEATTITTALLIGLQRSKSSLEASWKYILIASVGIALAFVGTVLGYFNFVQRVGQTDYALHWTVLSQVAPRLNADVLRLCFVFILVGYGTKAGLAPMYTWLPDAHSEAPAPVSSVMSGTLLAVALYAILRWKIVVDARLGSSYTDRMMILAGVISVVVAGLLMVRQASYKRMLAYSSVEHMGLMCLGLGFGPLGAFASLLHLIGHAASKSMLFLLTGSILERYHSTRISSVKGLLSVMPWTGGLFLAGGLALLGLPPFGLFISEILLFRAGFRSGHPWVTGFLILVLVAIFVSLLGHFNRLLYGLPPEKIVRGDGDRSGLAVLLFNVAALLILGLMIPAPLDQLLRQIVKIVHP
jgi:hydrogenase-4 component F